jgi:hypothetical protein
MGLVFFVAWLVLCGAAAVYAASKGRSGVGIFFLSFFLSPLVGFVVTLVMSPDEQKVATAQGKKKCPQCAEFVQPEAKICRFCQHKFEEESEAEQLAACGISPGPACPKCGSVSTDSSMESVKVSRWWKAAVAPFLHCRKCGEKWQPEDSVPVESVRMAAVVLLAAFILVGLMLLFALAPRIFPNNSTSSSGRSDKEAGSSTTAVPAQSAGVQQPNPIARAVDSASKASPISSSQALRSCGNSSLQRNLSSSQL